MKMTVGAGDKKKVVILGGLLVVAAIILWINSSSSGEIPSNPAPKAAGGILRPTTPLVAPRRPVDPDTPVRARTGTGGTTTGSQGDQGKSKKGGGPGGGPGAGPGQ